MRRRRGIMGLNGGAGIPVITATATGNPLTFETDMIKPLKSLVIPFTPIQAAGTPSPDNPLPISGWAECDINKTNASGNIINLVSGNIINVSNGYTIRSGYQLYFASNTHEAVVLFPVKPNTVYTYVAQKSSGGSSNMTVFEYSDKPTNKSEYQIGTITESFTMGTTLRRKTFTTSANAKYVGIDIHKGSGTDANTVSFSAYIGENTTDTFGNYAVDTIPVAFTDPTTGDPMTVYGGTLTLNEDGSADLVSNWQYGIVSALWPSGWSYISDNATPYFEHNTNVKTGLRESSLCSEYKYAVPAAGAMPDLSFGVISNGTRIRIRNSNYTTVNAFMAAMADVYISFPLLDSSRSIKTYHFDNIGQLTTFVGTNNIWTDTNGTNTATYLKHQS